MENQPVTDQRLEQLLEMGFDKERSEALVKDNPEKTLEKIIEIMDQPAKEELTQEQIEV